MVNRAWTVRPYATGDEEAIVELYKLVYNREITTDIWRWKFKGRPTSRDNVWLAVDGSNVPIFHLGAMPCRLNRHGREDGALVLVDAMTHPAFRRQGALTAVWREMIADWKAADCRLLLGLPNEQWGSRKRVLGWQPLFPLVRLVRPLRPDHLLGYKLGLRRLEAKRLASVWNGLWEKLGPKPGDVNFRELTDTKSIDMLWRVFAPHIGHSVVRDQSWVQWRYRDVPHLRYMLIVGERDGVPVGFAVYRFRATSVGTIMVIPDMFSVGDQSVLHALVSEVVRRAMAECAEAIMILTGRHSRLHHALRKHGFLRHGGFGFECVSLDDQMSLTDLRRPGSWHVTGGDFDVAY